MEGCSATIGQTPTGCNCSTPNIYQWSFDDGATWSNYGTHLGFSYVEDMTFCVRTQNCNGTSTNLCKLVPPPNHVPGHSRIAQPEISTFLFPNPVGDYLLLQNIREVTGVEEKEIEVSIFDITGRIFYHQKQSGDDIIGTANLTNGSYLLGIQWGDGNKKIVKFTKINRK